MGKEFHFTCDGCGIDRKNKDGKLPSGFADISVTAEGFTNWVSGGGKTVSLTVLLCGSCQIDYASHLSPATWPNAKPVMGRKNDPLPL